MKKIALNIASLPEGLKGKSAPALKKIINDAVAQFGIDKSWAAPKTNDVDELIAHIDELCNEHRITPDGSGKLVKSSVDTVAAPGGIYKGVLILGQSLDKLHADLTKQQNALSSDKKFASYPESVQEAVKDQFEVCRQALVEADKQFRKLASNTSSM